MKKALMVELKPVRVVIDVKENASDQEIIQATNEAFLALGSKVLAGAKYAFTNADDNALSFENVFLSQVVKTNDGKYGIVTKINKKSINVTIPTKLGFPSTVQGSPSLYTKIEGKVESLLNPRSEAAIEMGVWREGHVGYLVDHRNNKIHFITIIQELPSGKMRIKIVHSNTNSYWDLSPAHVKAYLFDKKADAKKCLTATA